MITLFFWSRFYISESSARPREEDFVTRAEAQCLQAVREERRRDAALTDDLQKFSIFRS